MLVEGKEEKKTFFPRKSYPRYEIGADFAKKRENIAGGGRVSIQAKPFDHVKRKSKERKTWKKKNFPWKG